MHTEAIQKNIAALSITLDQVRAKSDAATQRVEQQAREIAQLKAQVQALTTQIAMMRAGV
ncbi:MAG: hypothetical protein AAGE52_01295 [Myxococcota bacterium]